MPGVVSTLPPPARREQRDLRDRFLELVHGGHGHREERGGQQSAQHGTLAAARALEQAIDEIHDEQGIRGLGEADEQHFDAGVVNADPAGHGHDRGYSGGE